MEIGYRTRRLARICLEAAEAQRQLGPANARKLQQRLFELRTTDNLADMMQFASARCHALRGDRAGQYAVSLQGPWRLVFVPDVDPLPRRADGGLDLAAVSAIEIMEVEDYHG
jgi:proteic killer suppression protein